MIGNGVSARPRDRDRTLEGTRRGLDLAEGILIGWRRYRPAAAFEELVDVAVRHGLSVSAGDIDTTESTTAATLAAQLQWGDLLIT